MVEVKRLRATRDITYAGSLVRKGAEFDYTGDGTHKYGVPVELPAPPEPPPPAADLKPETARKAARQKAVNPAGDSDLV